MVEFHESLLESFGRVEVEACEEDCEDCGEVLLNSGAGTSQLHIPIIVCG